MSERLTKTWRLDIEVLTPLHIGTGTTLQDGYDFVAHKGKTYRLDVNTFLDAIWPKDPRQQDAMLGQPPAQLLEPDDFVNHPEFFAYALNGVPQGAKREVRECIKDPKGAPYIPGSTLKGAFRTALLASLEAQPLVGAGRAEDPRRAARPLENKWLGATPHTDILRALRITDSEPAPKSSLYLQPIQMVPNLVINVEAMGPGTRMTAEASLDVWLLGQRGARGLNWKEEAETAVRKFLQNAKTAAGRRLAFEYEYHQARAERFHSAEDEGCRAFYTKIAKALTEGKRPGFPLQIGFATGWRAKTVLGVTADNDLERIIRQYSLDRGGRGRGGAWRPGQPFPKARHIALVGGNRFLPVGWVWIEYDLVK